MIATGWSGVLPRQRGTAEVGTGKRNRKFKPASGATISELPRGAIKTIGNADRLVEQALGKVPKERHAGINIWRNFR